jgi:UPF0042 nucleotide-binding protein
LSLSSKKENRAAKPLVVIVTGLSGSGKTVVLRTIEDSGFFCVDNLPPQLIDEFIRIALGQKDISRVGIGIDVREKEFLSKCESTLEALAEKYNLVIIFLEAEKPALIRRYKETRRPHPIPGESLESSIEAERQMLGEFRRHADKIIDTTNFSPHQLRDLVNNFLGLEGAGFQLHVISFGYKFGIPQHADLIFDARFLPNPFFEPELKDLCGLDDPVKKFVLKNKLTKDFVKKLNKLFAFLIPHYKNEGKSSLTIAIGCTGGKHRSPVIAELVASNIKKFDLPVSVLHRDI